MWCVSLQLILQKARIVDWNRCRRLASLGGADYIMLKRAASYRNSPQTSQQSLPSYGVFLMRHLPKDYKDYIQHDDATAGQRTCTLHGTSPHLVPKG